MKTLYFIIALLFLSSSSSKSQILDTAFFQGNYDATSDRIIDRIMQDSLAWEHLAYMCDTYGTRLSGSVGLEQSLDWLAEQMKKDGLENVHKEKVMVPVWRRNKEYCQMIEPRKKDFRMLGLGGSIATPKDGITAHILMVQSFDELDQRASEAKGKIVVFNSKWQDYGKTVQYRFNGADAASKYGALAVLVRSVSPVGLNNVHTGMMYYSDEVKRIPIAAITHEDTDMLDRMQKRGQNPLVKLYMEADTLPDALSYNLIAEIKGSEKPDEIVAFGGHIDSWDIGQGAHDDGAACIAAWHILKVFKELNIRPKRTLRAVMWANEENGVRGGKQYAIDHKDEKHALLLEWDCGVFPPQGLGFMGDEGAYKLICNFIPLLKKIRPVEATKARWVGVDIGPMMKQNNVPSIGFDTDDGGVYFWYHHSPIDTPDKIDPKIYNECIAAIALSVFIYADMPIDLMQFVPKN